MVAVKKILLMTLLIGLTLISLMAGFNFYQTLFGLSTAIICSIVFESLRLGCLWGIALPGWSSKGVALPLYVIVAGSCSFAAITQFHAEIIEQYARERKPYEQEITRRVKFGKNLDYEGIAKVDKHNGDWLKIIALRAVPVDGDERDPHRERGRSWNQDRGTRAPAARIPRNTEAPGQRAC